MEMVQEFLGGFGYLVQGTVVVLVVAVVLSTVNKILKSSTSKVSGKNSAIS